MAGEPTGPALKQLIPHQITNEGAAYGPFDLKKFVNAPVEDGRLVFSAELENGQALPTGLMCTEDGELNGIPAAGTAGHYNIVVTVSNQSPIPLLMNVDFTIKPRLTAEDPFFLTSLKSKVWEALGQNLPLPDMGDLLNRPVTAIEVYYLLQRWATLTVWDVYNLDYPGEKVLITLPGQSSHYHIYDRGSCLVGAPKDLYSHERTLEDALQTARAIAREVYKRGWTIEFAGFNKMVRAAWVELQILGDVHGKQLEIMHYTPSSEDLKLYVNQAKAKGPQNS